MTTTSRPEGTPSSTTAPPDGTNGGNGDGQKGPGDFGDLKDVCGPAEGDNADDDRAGRHADEIKIGTISDPGFAGRPGLNQELFDTANVFAGLVQRRRRHQRPQDRRHQARRHAHQVQAADHRGLRRGLLARRWRRGVRPGRARKTASTACCPTIAGYVVSPQARGSDLQVQPLPNASTTLPIGDYKYLEKKFPDATEKVGVLTGDVARHDHGRQAEQGGRRRRSAGTNVYKTRTTRPARPTGRRTPRR